MAPGLLKLPFDGALVDGRRAATARHAEDFARLEQARDRAEGNAVLGCAGLIVSAGLAALLGIGKRLASLARRRRPVADWGGSWESDFRHDNHEPL